jgi:hypothetical protein
VMTGVLPEFCAFMAKSLVIPSAAGALS